MSSRCTQIGSSVGSGRTRGGEPACTVSGMAEGEGRFAPGVGAWLAGAGLVRDVVRQELVRRQLADHLPARGGRLRVLDAGCGQGTRAIALARSGHEVVGLDVSDRLLGEARRAVADELSEVRDCLSFVIGDVLALGDEHADGYDVVCCHGVAMYLPALDEVVAALLRAARPGGLVSILTRNRAGIAMRAGMTGDWPAALSGFDACHYDNRLGVQGVRADEPGEVRATLVGQGAEIEAWYGVRLFSDHWASDTPVGGLDGLMAAEAEAGRRDPYRAVCALTHTIARR